MLHDRICISHTGCNERQDTGDNKDSLGQEFHIWHLEKAVLVSLVADLVMIPDEVPDCTWIDGGKASVASYTKTNPCIAFRPTQIPQPTDVVIQDGVCDCEFEGEENDGVR